MPGTGLAPGELNPISWAGRFFVFFFNCSLCRFLPLSIMLLRFIGTAAGTVSIAE